MSGRYEELDYLWFYSIHYEWSHSVLDAVLPFIRNQFFWAPLYLFLALYSIINYKLKGLYWCVAYLITFGIGDYISSSILKPYFARIRPCRDEAFEEIIRNIVHCGGGYSFPSSHAVNHFAMAIFIAVTLGGSKKMLVCLSALAWAVSIGYSQIYVGVHFPFDVISGAILGIAIGMFTGLVFRKLVKLK